MTEHEDLISLGKKYQDCITTFTGRATSITSQYGGTVTVVLETYEDLQIKRESFALERLKRA